MCEKRVRKLLEKYQYQTGRTYKCEAICAGCGGMYDLHYDDCPVKLALAEPPDLVELLWRIKARITDCRIKVAEEEYATSFWTHLKATESTLDEIACYINRVFGIRLTEDGEWEYTEEER